MFDFFFLVYSIRIWIAIRDLNQYCLKMHCIDCKISHLIFNMFLEYSHPSIFSLLMTVLFVRLLYYDESSKILKGKTPLYHRECGSDYAILGMKTICFANLHNEWYTNNFNELQGTGWLSETKRCFELLKGQETIHYNVTRYSSWSK